MRDPLKIAEAIREAGVPDCINRWLAPEEWNMKPGPKETSLRATRMGKAGKDASILGQNLFAAKIIPCGVNGSKVLENPDADQPATPKTAEQETTIMASKATQSRTRTAIKPTTRTQAAKTKTELAADLIRRKNGCTSADILAATGWPAVSVPAIAKATGIKLLKDKQPGEATRYRAG